MTATTTEPVTERAERDEAPLLVYFSSESGNTARFVEKLGRRAVRIPLGGDEDIRVDEPYVLLTPTFSGGEGQDIERGAVPKQVIRFLNDEENRSRIRGVISMGNSNFGVSFGLAGDIVSRKCRVPHLYRLELFGTPEDVDRVNEGLERWWKQH